MVAVCSKAVVLSIIVDSMFLVAPIVCVGLCFVMQNMTCAVVPAKSDSDVSFCLQSYQVLTVELQWLEL